MSKYYHMPIWADPAWDCDRREILPEDDERLDYRCDHCDAKAQWQPSTHTDELHVWCDDHAPFRHPDDEMEPACRVRYRLRYDSLRQLARLSRQPTPAPVRKVIDVSNVSNLAAALADHYAAFGNVEIMALDIHDDRSAPGSIELPLFHVWGWR